MMYRMVNPETGMFIEDVILSSPPILEDGEPDPAYIETPVPGDAGFWWPRWDGEAWVEGLTAEEIAARVAAAPPPEPTPDEEWKLGIEAALIELAGMVTGGA